MDLRKLAAAFLGWAVVFALGVQTQAVTIELVPVGNPGNADDIRDWTPGYGGVGYSYLIAKYEITNAQWREFLTAKASVGDPHELYCRFMDGLHGGIARSGSGTSVDPWEYYARNHDSNWDNRPVNYVSFWNAARFCNWLHNGQGNSDTELGSYLNIGNVSTFTRKPDATYVIPTVDEWYKAAYHRNDGITGNYWDYPTGTDAVPNNGNPGGDTGNTANFYDETDYTVDGPYYTTPVGYFGLSLSPYGTCDQGGNLWEWTESATGDSRIVRGGDWFHLGPGNPGDDFVAGNRGLAGPPTSYSNQFGFRVASVPEPSSIAFLVAAAIVGVLCWGRSTFCPRSR